MSTYPLPYDYGRCSGTTHPNCQTCRRREPGRELWQSYIMAPMDTLTGLCNARIRPPKSAVIYRSVDTTGPYPHTGR